MKFDEELWKDYIDYTTEIAYTSEDVSNEEIS